MVVLEGWTIDGIFCVQHPDLANRSEFEQSVGQYGVVVALITQMLEVHLPRGVLYFAFIIRREAYAILPVVVVITTHVVVTVVTVNRHQRVEEHLTTGDTGSCHTTPNLGLEVLHHIHSSYKVVLVVLLQSLFELSVTYVSLIGIILIGITMTHESNDALCSICAIKSVQFLSHELYIGLSILQQGYTKFQFNIGQIAIVEVAIRVVGEVLDVVDYTGVLLAGNYLERLNHDLAVLHTLGSKGIEPEGRSIVVTDLCTIGSILTGSGTVDTDG